MLVREAKDYAVKHFYIDGIEVASEVVKISRDLPEDAVAVHVRSSCQSRRWGSRTAVNVLTAYPHPRADFDCNLERFRKGMAESLAKTELGLTPQRARFLGVHVSRPDSHNPCAWLATVDLRTGPTRIMADMVEPLGLQPSGRSSYEIGEDARVVVRPLFKAKLKCGSQEWIIDVLPTEMSLPCVIGTELLQMIVGNRVELLHDLLDPDHWRAIRNVARCKRNVVLIIGKYGENIKRLREIQETLERTGHQAVILEDFPDIEEQSLPEKMLLFASIARFVICDDSSPSGHNLELQYCRQLEFTTAILRPGGRASTSMQADITRGVDYIEVFPYSEDSFSDQVLRATRWAEEVVVRRSSTFNQTYAWRSPERVLS